MDHLDLPPKRACRGLHLFQLSFGVRNKSPIEEYRDQAGGNELVQQFQPLSFEIDAENADACDILSRPIEAFSVAELDRIAAKRGDDRDRDRSGRGDRSNGCAASRDDHRHPSVD